MTHDRVRWALAGWLILACMFAAVLWRDDSGAEEQHLRAQFRLEPGTDFAAFDVTRPSFKENVYEIEGIVRFDEAQFDRYHQAASFGGRWDVAPLTLDGLDFPGTFANPAARWQSLGQAHHFAFGSLSYDESQRVTQGSVLCFQLVVPHAGTPPSEGFRPCRPGGADGERGYVVQGLLDPQTRSLHMLIRRYGPWPRAG